MYYVTTELYHHGILGMKWGKRNGPPYPLSPGDHSASEKKAGWRKSLDKPSREPKEPGKLTKKLASNYAEQYETIYGGRYTHENAQKAGMDKAKIMKRVAIGAGVVVGVSAAAYLYKQYGLNFADNMIDAGTTIQTLSMDPDRMINGEAFYTAYRDADKIAYQAMFGQQQANFMGIPFGPVENKQIITAMVDKGIKVAGSNTGHKVFNDLMKSDPTFKKGVMDMLSTPDAQMFKLQRSPFMSDYEVFNGIGLLDSSYTSLQKNFYEKLKDLGYGAVTDINDRKYSGYNTAAVLVFDRSNLSKPVSTLLQDSQIQVAQGKNMMRVLGDMLESPMTAVLGGGVALGVADKVADKRNDKKYGSKDSK